MLRFFIFVSGPNFISSTSVTNCFINNTTRVTSTLLALFPSYMSSPSWGLTLAYSGGLFTFSTLFPINVHSTCITSTVHQHFKRDTYSHIFMHFRWSVYCCVSSLRILFFFHPHRKLTFDFLSCHSLFSTFGIFLSDYLILCSDWCVSVLLHRDVSTFQASVIYSLHCFSLFFYEQPLKNFMHFYSVQRQSAMV